MAYQYLIASQQVRRNRAFGDESIRPGHVDDMVARIEAMERVRIHKLSYCSIILSIFLFFFFLLLIIILFLKSSGSDGDDAYLPVGRYLNKAVGKRTVYSTRDAVEIEYTEKKMSGKPLNREATSSIGSAKTSKRNCSVTNVAEHCFVRETTSSRCEANFFGT